MRTGGFMSICKAFDEFLAEALPVVELGDKNGVSLRLIGALAVYHHCPGFRFLYDEIKRVPTDIDFVAYSTSTKKLPDIMSQAGYDPDKWIMSTWFAKERHIYYSRKSNLKVDVFFDKLVMNHEIDFKGTLGLDSPTITLANLLLTKMQIVKINEKDIKDSIILLREHTVGDSDRDTINLDYLARRLSDDWGFWFTFTTNLEKIKKFVPDYVAINEKDRDDVVSKADRILQTLHGSPKSMKWKMRARIGPSKKWYTEVEEVVTGDHLR